MNEIIKKIEQLKPENQKYFYDIIRDITDSEEYSQRFKNKSILEIYKEVYGDMFDENGNLKSSTLDTLLQK